MMGMGSGPAGRKPSRRKLIGISAAVIVVLAFVGWRMTRAPTAAAAIDKDGTVPPLVRVSLPASGRSDRIRDSACFHTLGSHSI